MQDNNSAPRNANSIYDVAVIGTGVVGCAMARRFALEGASVIAIEKAPDILDGASKANSAILHTGFDEPSDFLELECIKAGYREYMEIHDRLNLPVMETGALVVAWSDEEEQKLDSLMDRARNNGVGDVERLTIEQIRTREPHLSDHLTGGFLVPREYVIDPWTSPFAYMLQAIENGAEILRDTEVTGGEFDGELWQLETGAGNVRCRAVINCAGLYGDRVDHVLIGESDFTIRPRKGQFVVFDKSASNLVSSIILPVPSETTKGVVITRTIFGNLLVGPTAEEQDDRDDASVDTETLQFLRRKGQEMIPDLANHTVTATYAGIRPATEEKDFRIRHYADKHYVSVGGIRSTGLSAALGIASHVFEAYAASGVSHEPPSPCIWPDISPIAEIAQRGWEKPDNGGIVCHCELVAKAEIENALSGPLAARSLAGLKRRTRVTMGRCQGFYCSAALSDLTAGRFNNPIGLRGGNDS